MIRLGTVGPCIDPSRRGAVPLGSGRRLAVGGGARPCLPPFVFRAGGGGRPKPDARGIAPKAPSRWMNRTGVPVPESGKPRPLGPARPNPGTPGCSQAPWTRPSRQVGPGARMSGYHAAIGPGRVPGRPMRCRQAAPHHAACRRPVSLPWGLHKGSVAERRTRGAPRTDRACKGRRPPPEAPSSREPPQTRKRGPKGPLPVVQPALTA